MKKKINFSILAVISFVVITIIVSACLLITYNKINYEDALVINDNNSIATDYLIEGESINISYNSFLSRYNETKDLSIEDFKEKYELKNSKFFKVENDKIIALKEGKVTVEYISKEKYKKTDSRTYKTKIKAFNLVILTNDYTDYIKIETPNDLINLTRDNPGSKYIISNDIDFTDIKLDNSLYLNGIFINPNGYTIKNVSYDGADSNSQLFEYSMLTNQDANTVFLGLKFQDINLKINNTNSKFYVDILPNNIVYMRDITINDFKIELQKEEIVSAELFLTPAAAKKIINLSIDCIFYHNENSSLNLIYQERYDRENVKVNINTDMIVSKQSTTNKQGYQYNVEYTINKNE